MCVTVYSIHVNWLTWLNRWVHVRIFESSQLEGSCVGDLLYFMEWLNQGSRPFSVLEAFCKKCLACNVCASSILLLSPSPPCHHHCYLVVPPLLTFRLDYGRTHGSPLGPAHSQMSQTLWWVHFLAMTFPHAKLSNPFSCFPKHKVWLSVFTPSQLSNCILSLVLHPHVLSEQPAYCPGHASCSELCGESFRISIQDWGTPYPRCWECWWMMVSMLSLRWRDSRHPRFIFLSQGQSTSNNWSKVGRGCYKDPSPLLQGKARQLWNVIQVSEQSMTWTQAFYMCDYIAALGFLGGSVVKNLPANAGDSGLIPGSGKSPGGGNGKPLQYFCLENPMGYSTWGCKESDTTK